ncbi:MAG: hypothetical protein JWM56_348 [Candidatus Peribacteria bacterium]|nr:hypothetical protein [Candidatus Peribacteria bacterium]
MKSWPPSIPASDAFIGAFQSMKENIRIGLRKKDMSFEDSSLARYMRTLNVGTRLVRETDGPYARDFVVCFDTVTARAIRPRLLRVFRPSPNENDVFMVPTDVTHAAANSVSTKESIVLADELVGGFYEQYDIAVMMGVSKKELRKISTERYETELREIYEMIRNRALHIIKVNDLELSI